MGELFNEICSIKNLTLTFEKLKNKRCGADGVWWEDINKQKFSYLTQLHDELINEVYIPNRDVFLQKPYFPGSNKILSYVEMNIREKIVEYAIKNIVYPIFDSKWCDFSCAYRKGKGEIYANLLLAKYKENGFWSYISVDIKSYYQDIVNSLLRDNLMSMLSDLSCVELIETCLQTKEKETGIPVGHVLSTLCSNVYLHPIDIKFSKYNIIRYADNYCFASKNENELFRIVEELQDLLLTYGLTLNNNKTKIVFDPQSFRDILT